MLEKKELFSIREQVLQEIHSEFSKEDPNVIGRFLNNFFVKVFTAINSKKALQYGYWDKENLQTSPLERWIQQSDPSWKSDPKTVLLEWGHSEKYLQETGVEHLQNIIYAVSASGINIDQLERYLENYQQYSSEQETENLLLPIYIKLREMGYTHEDLRISN